MSDDEQAVARVGDLTAHGVAVQGPGSADVLVNGQKAWRAMPPGVGEGVGQASSRAKAIMDRPPFMPPDVVTELGPLTSTMSSVGAQAEAAGAPGASATVSTSFAGLASQATALAAGYTAAAAVPGGEPGARVAFTTAFKAALAQTMATAVHSIAGPWDMDTCVAPGPAGPHGPGVVIKGSETVLINNLPAVFKGHRIVEASGGPTAIRIGSANVFIGDITPPVRPSSSSESAAKRTSPPRSRNQAPNSSIANSPPGTSPLTSTSPDSLPEKSRKENLWIRLDVEPGAATKALGSDSFKLVSVDGSYCEEKTVKRDKIANARSVDLQFTALDPDGSYTLTVRSEDKELTLFSSLPYVEFSDLQGTDEPAPEATSPEAADGLEQVRPSTTWGRVS